MLQDLTDHYEKRGRSPLSDFKCPNFGHSNTKNFMFKFSILNRLCPHYTSRSIETVIEICANDISPKTYEDVILLSKKSILLKELLSFITKINSFFNSGFYSNLREYHRSFIFEINASSDRRFFDFSQKIENRMFEHFSRK